MTEAGAPEDAGAGATLARARQALGLSVADVALQLKFAARQIEALEQGRYQELPAGTFARGMVRAYARLLKLDPEPLVGQVAPHVTVPDNAVAAAVVRRSIPIVDSARRTNLIYAGLSLGLVAVIAAVALEWNRERSRAARMTFIPAAQAPQEGTQEAPQKAAQPAGGTVQPASPAALPAQVAEASSNARPAPVPADGLHRIVLRFERESWVEVRGAGGKLLTSELNRAGTERMVDGRPPFSLIVGNAQHVRVSYDDRPVDLAPHVKVEVARFTLE
jgi:cytoskeleton protein RodZ